MPLHYHRLGHGPHVLLAFHGIGQEGASCYQPLADALGDYYTIYAFDLFFHGQSRDLLLPDTISEDKPITKAAWKQIIQDFLSSHSIDRFDVAGFSMGGRFALATLEAFPERIDKAFLMAPDGVSEHPLYGLATRLAPARRLFHWVLDHHETLIHAARLLEKTRLISGSLVRFVQHMLATPERRHTVYHSWVAFRQLRFDIPALYNTLQKHGVLVYLFMGRHDQMLRPAQVAPLSRLLPPDQYHILNCGHTRLVAHATPYISTLLK
ncbi:alpha/beta fold hydrolase [Telluribacter sp. SYSU D00476]|uniref:alpha/beta fold hydrolase n=1 Tax=Telluribacter sp. SYSU D00476 TaxID=2811430 RepID=UPI001FF1765C|nr:alpha/beta fold hydrolase [Telluribacter sp. SYSU D00476]